MATLTWMLSVERWRLRAARERGKRLFGRYCCARAAATGKTNCGECGTERAEAILAAHGLSVDDLGPARIINLSVAAAKERLR